MTADGSAPAAFNSLPAAPGPLGLLGLLEAHDRHGAVVARLSVTHWPVTIGRALHCDLVLDDPHVAAEHLQLDLVPPPEQSVPATASSPQPASAVQIFVLPSINGATLVNTHLVAGARRKWVAGDDLKLGRLRLNLRLTDAPIAAELPLPRMNWQSAALTATLVLATLAWTLTLLWVGTQQTDKFAQTLPTFLAGAVGVLVVWSGLWALATKLFTGHPHFWQHVRILCGAALAEGLLTGAAHLLAFMFSLEGLARFDFLISSAVFSAGLYWQFKLTAPLHARFLRNMMVVLFAAGVITTLGSNWMQLKQLGPQRQLASLFPPSWRIAKPVPVSQFTQEAMAIKQRLAERLKDEQTSDVGDDHSGDD